MSVLNQSGEEQVECPLCMEPLEVDDLHFYPCTCGYQICRFCWNRIREGENGLCPACRKAYPENPADFTPLSQEQVAAIKTEKRAREQRRRNKTLESRRQLANVRVVQNNLVFVVGLPVRLAHPEILKRQEYFGKYGKIHKVVINQSTTYAGSQCGAQGPSASAYVTYVSGADALRAIQSVNNVSIDGRVLKGSLGTTKYCANFMKNQPCPKTDCMYLHELGDPKASFTKEQMHQGLHQIYERKLHNQLLAATAAAATAGEGGAAGANGGSSAGNVGSNGGKAGGTGFIPTTIITSTNAHTISSNKSKKDLQTTSSSPSSTSSSSTSSSTSSSSGGGKEAWPSLGCSPPAAGASRPDMQQQQGQSITNADSSQNIAKNNRDSNTTDNSNKNPGKSKDSNGSQPKPSNSISIKNGTRKGSCDDTYRNGSSDTEREQEDEEELVGNGYSDNKHFDNYMGDNLDIDTDDRHSLLDNHDLLDSSEHSLLEDEVHGHNMNEGILQRHMLDRQGVESSSLVDTFGLLDSNRDLRGYLADRIQNHSSLLESKELMMLRERQESEMLMRQNEMLARRNHLNMLGEQGKHYMGVGGGSLGLESTSELLGTPYPPTSPHLLPPLGLSRLEGPRYGAAKPPSHVVSNGDARGAESGRFVPFHLQASKGSIRYIGENSMDKFITDFHKNQQMKFLMQQSQVQPIQQAQGPLHHQPLPTSTDGIHHPFHPEMHSHAIIESQHLQRKYGNIINSNQSGCGNTVSNVSDESSVTAGSVNSAGQTPRIVDDDLDFDPFKETQKALAEMMESEVLVQQNGSGSSRTDASERLRHSRPPPGFSHMNAFGIGVPRPQATPQGFSSSSAMISDWTQIDPAIMSTSVNFPQKNLLQQSLLTHQQQELYARFNQGLNINPQPPNGISKLLLNGQHPALAQQMQGMASQRLPQHNGMVLNPNQLINGQSNQQYLAPHLQQNKLQNIMSNPPNGWALNNLSPNFSGLNLNANGIYGSHVQAALLANGTVENTKAYNSISLPPGFTNLAQNSKASPIPTECIESK